MRIPRRKRTQDPKIMKTLAGYNQEHFAKADDLHLVKQLTEGAN